MLMIVCRCAELFGIFGYFNHITPEFQAYMYDQKNTNYLFAIKIKVLTTLTKTQNHLQTFFIRVNNNLWDHFVHKNEEKKMKIKK